MKTLGIIQSRGLGDLFIALPIALYYKEQGYDRIVWPICEPFMPTMQQSAPWIDWVPLRVDRRGAFFYEEAWKAVKYQCDEVICLYQYLSSMPELSDPDLFPILKFDQYKYAVAGVPFKWKQRLGECLTRDPAVEARVKQQVVPEGRPYIVVHTEGSDVGLNLDWSDAEAQGYSVVHIREGVTDNLVNWLGVIEGAESLYLIDSSVANLVDGLDLHRDKWFIRRSKMDLTPVLLSDWQYFPLSDLGVK